MTFGATEPPQPGLRRRLRGYPPEAVEHALARATKAIQEISDERDRACEELERVRQEVDRLQHELDHQKRISRNRGEALLSRLLGGRGDLVRRNGSPQTSTPAGTAQQN